MSYLDAGYNEFLTREQEAPIQVDALESDYSTPSVSASKIVGGLLASQNGMTQFDLEKNTFKVSDGTQDRVTLGVLPDESIGLLVKDVYGNILMQISGDTNIIKSSDQSLSIDFKEAQIIVRNEGKIPVVLLGKQTGGF